jgi:hypothetical protein
MVGPWYKCKLINHNHAGMSIIPAKNIDYSAHTKPPARRKGQLREIAR